MKKGIRTSIIAVGIFLLVIIFNPFSCVSASSRGVRTRFSAVVGGAILPGLQIRIPIVERILQFSIQPQQVRTRIPVGEEGAITKDNQTVGVSVQIFYRYSDDRIPEIAKNYSEEKLRSIITYTCESAVKTVLGSYTIFQIAETQIEVTDKVIALIKASIRQYPIEMVDLKLTNYDWSEKFDTQIAETMEKAQQVKQKEQELQVATLEAQKQVRQAEAAKQALIAQAEGEKAAQITRAEGEKQKVILEADAKVAQGEGIRKYNQALAATLDIQIRLKQLDIEMARVDKWNGQYVPNNMYGPIPFTSGGIQGVK